MRGRKYQRPRVRAGLTIKRGRGRRSPRISYCPLAVELSVAASSSQIHYLDLVEAKGGFDLR
jgi:hypothetical protein